MQRGGSRPSLGERAADSGVPGAGAAHETAPVPRPAARPAAQPGGRPAARPGGRHCWVHDPPEWPGTWPGLLVEWRQRPDGWHGRVTYTVGGPHGPVLVEAWLPADRLEQR